MSELKISRILHAGYVFERQNRRIAFDPILENPFSQNCHAFPQVRFDQVEISKLKLDAVFISHHHDDHCSLESLVQLDRRTPIFLYCQHEALFDWIRELGFLSVQELRIDQAVCIGSFEVVPRRALDAEVDSMFQIRTDGLNILNVVDSWIDDETLKLLVNQGPWDLILWPFQTMREIEVLSPSRAEPPPPPPPPTGHLPPEWIHQLRALNPRRLVPSSCQFLQEEWSWYNRAFFPISYLQFQKEIELALPHCEVVRLNPGVSISLSAESMKFAKPLSWVVPVGEQDVDYEFDPHATPTPTGEIAKKFAPLTPEQTARVRRYCEVGLVDKSESLHPPEDHYFRTPRTWRLQVFDDEGQAATFFYRVMQNGLKRLPVHEGPLGWTTDIPMAKLLAGIENGESLTSMYIRVNDHIFDADVEKEISSVDVLEDPLIRCLFSGSFGAYQWAQLCRLRRKSSNQSCVTR
ncbi:MAG: MBL fold metallo-hydrolase [Bdellovibrio sp.]